MQEWLSEHFSRLSAGQMTQFRPAESSMMPVIRPGQLVTFAPIDGKLAVGDIVLCTMNSTPYIAEIKAIKTSKCLIGDLNGNIFGWTTPESIVGIVYMIND